MIFPFRILFLAHHSSLTYLTLHLCVLRQYTPSLLLDDFWLSIVDAPSYRLRPDKYRRTTYLIPPPRGKRLCAGYVTL